MTIAVVVHVSKRRKWYVFNYLRMYYNVMPVLRTNYTITASTRTGQRIPAGHCQAHTVLYVSVVNCDVHSNCKNYFA